MSSRWTAALLLATACYEPVPHAACEVACDFASAGADAPCPAGLLCGAQGRCVGATTDSCDAIDAATTDDAPTDVIVDAPSCFGPLTGSTEQICFVTALSGDVVLSQELSTTTCKEGEIKQVQGEVYCVISAARISVTSTVIAMGTSPLLLLASESITIEPNATLDASSRSSLMILGAGSNSRLCHTTGIDASETLGGGAGGTFQGRGGNGGGTGAGMRAPDVLPDAFHGGCPGGRGGNVPNTGGRGGGALYLSAPNIFVRGNIVVAGEGGKVGPDGAGGGGGGSGGMISLVGSSISVSSEARLVAAGGGGGSGRDTNGLPGETATASDPVADGGDGSGNAGDGGKGSDPVNASMGVAATAGGGGGGGGAGYIDIRQNGTSILCSPPVCVPASTL